MTRFCRSIGFFAAIVLIIGCSKEENLPAGPDLGQTVSGKVTYGGTIVPYGFVLFYDDSKFAFVNKDQGRVVPLCFSPIENGRYIIHDAPVGLVQICVATDPDVDLQKFLDPTTPGGIEIPNEPGGDPPMPPDHKFKDEKHKIPGNPLLEKFTGAQIQMLRDIHRQYGVFGKTPLRFAVSKGKQEFDIIIGPIFK